MRISAMGTFRPLRSLISVTLRAVPDKERISALTTDSSTGGGTTGRLIEDTSELSEYRLTSDVEAEEVMAEGGGVGGAGLGGMLLFKIAITSLKSY
jgi:hypothetical protein